MSKIADKAREALGEFLDPDEQVLEASKAQIEGGIMRTATSAGLDIGVGGVVGALGAYKVESGASDLAKELAGGAVLVATNKRLIVMSATSMNANPKDVVLWVDRSSITGFTEGSKRVMLNKLMTITVSTTGDAPDLVFEFPKIANKDARAVVEALS